MSPLSPNLNSGITCEIPTEGVNKDNSVTEKQLLFVLRLVKFCQLEGSFCQRLAEIFSYSIPLMEASTMDLIKSTTFQQTITALLCDNFGHNSCTSVNDNQLIFCPVLQCNCCTNKTSPVLNRPEESMPRSMELRVNNPPEVDEQVEPQCDSGFGSGAWQPSVSLDSAEELNNLIKNRQELSQCCFYHGSIDSQTSSSLLRKQPVGTFLIRDSSDSRYLYSLSVKTEKGATSIRIIYNNGFFQFDSNERIRHKLPQFNSVLALIDFHVKATEEGSNKLWRWEEGSGCKSLKVVLKRSLKNSVPSLAHLSRLKINQCMNNVEFPQLTISQLELDSDLEEMLMEYPYRV